MPPETVARPSRPRLSVVVATEHYDTIRGVVSALRRQHAPGIVELVIVLPPEANGSVRHDELAPLAGTKIVNVDGIMPMARARAAGIRRASAPFVFIGETHSFPQPGFTEAILAAFEGPWAAVVPAVSNANPQSIVSWIAYVFDYAAWGPRRPEGPIDDPLLYNTAFRRDLLLTFDDRLEAVLEATDAELWTRLHEEGRHAWFAKEAPLRHLNVATFSALLMERLSIGVMLGMKRAAVWPWRRRALYIAASPLIPLVLLGRFARRSFREIPPALVPVVVPGLVLCAFVKVAGELLGYLGLNLPALAARGVHFEIYKARYAGGAAP